MSEKPYFSCYHAGLPTYLSEKIQIAISDGRLIFVGTFGKACDEMVPVQESQFNGQNIACVGPRHKGCPRPQDAKLSET